jgi:hypothetical protein
VLNRIVNGTFVGNHVKHMLMVFENMVLRKIFGPAKEEAIGQ